MRAALLLGACVTAAAAAWAGGLREDKPVTLDTVTEPPPIRADEPFAQEFSPELAARALDTGALHWQKARNCAACHTIFPYLMARPVLAPILPAPTDVRSFVEEIVAGGRPTAPLPADSEAAVAVGSALALAFGDATTTGKLHPRTRQALDRLWGWQRPDGGWQWPFRDTPPVKSDEHYGVTLAVLGAGLAPEGYAQTEAARKGLDGACRYLKKHPPASLHQKAMLLWASRHVDGLLRQDEGARALAALLAAQRADGGWSMAQLVTNGDAPPSLLAKAEGLRTEKGHGTEFLLYAGQNNVYKSALASDGYATGLAVYVARQAGVPADDARLRRGIAWLKRNQRASGRWFTPSQGWHTKNLIANTGTAYAVLALHACGAVPPGGEQGKRIPR